MCLAIPGKVLSIDDDDTFGRIGAVDFGGVIKPAVLFSVLPEAKPGDYVIVHVGCALRIIDGDEVRKTLLEMGKIPAAKAA